MGRQVEAQLEDLALAGCLVQIAFFVEDDEGTAVVIRRPIVDFPDGSRLTGDLCDAFVFDCRNRQSANYWALEQLIDLGVPFRWS
ncbi:hypothetical protein [Stutzerimonas stutzeri]|uniref:hypothetical protein n=1 Tax=Stutzerimonas stutzeri TaxID=316 RepID=UPI003B7DBC03